MPDHSGANNPGTSLPDRPHADRDKPAVPDAGITPARRRAGAVVVMVMLAWLALSPDAVWAVGLGEARVESYLNQPLEVEIQLIDVSRDDLEALTVRPGNATDYRRVGLSLTALHADLEVTLEREREPAVVRVTTSKPVGDPVVQILLHARWSNGRVLREYTLFLDPPRVDLAPPPPEQADTGAGQRPAQQPESEPRESERARQAPPERDSQRPPASDVTPPQTRPADGEVQTGRYGPVGAGETLWSIAYAWRPDTSLSMNQVMLAFLQANPQAFTDGNVNNLQRGATLDYPDIDEVRAIDVRRAEQEIQAQMQAWQSAMGGDVARVSDAAVPEADDEPVDPEPDETAQPLAGETRSDEQAASGEEIASTSTTDIDEGRLQLVPPEEDTGAEGAAEGDPESEAEARRLRAALARAEEELLTSQLENEDLARQVDALREALEARDRGLSVTDTELAELETALRQAREAAALEAELAVSGDEAAEESAGDDAFDDYFAELGDELGVDPATGDGTGQPVPLRDEAGDEAGVAEPDETDTETGAAGETEEASGAETPEPGDVEDTNLRGFGWWLRQPWVWAAVGGLLLVGLVLVLMGVRRRTGGDGAVAGDELAADFGTGAESELDRARRQVEDSPDDLTAHVGLLEALAEHDQEREFNRALDEMYARVATDDDPDWQQALDIARLQAPTHPLVVAAAEPAADTGTGEATESEDDLMRILSEESASDDTEIDEIGSDMDEFADLSGSGDESSREGNAEAGLPDFDVAEEADSDLPNLGEQSPAGEDEPRSGRDTLALEDEDRTGLDFEVPSDQAADEDEVPVSGGEADTGMEFDFSEFQAPGTDDTESGEAPVEPESPDDGTIEWDLADDGVDERPEAAGAPATPAGEDLTDAETGVEAGNKAGDEGDSLFNLGEDEAEVKLDLARAYMSMGDKDAARAILEEVVAEGNENQRETARKMLDDSQT